MNSLMFKMRNLSVLFGTIFFGAYPAQAQDVTLQITPVQAQDPPTVQLNYNNPAVDPATLSAFKSWSIARLQGPADDLLGATLQPVGDALRTQLDIPSGQGLVVESLQGDGACAQVGLQQNDVLLQLDNVSLGAPNALTKALKAAGDSPVPLKILRAGKPVTIQVRPIYRVTLGPVGEQKTERYLGISVVGLSDALRSQLGLPEGKGMIVSEIEKGGPAEKGGIKKYDIVLELDGKLIDSAETLQRQVQTAQDQASLKILRAGKPVTIAILTGTRKVEANPNPAAAYRMLLLNRTTPVNTIYGLANGVQSQLGFANTDQSLVDANQWLRPSVVPNGQPADMNDLRQRLDQLEKELAAVRATLDKINETLKNKK